MPNNNRFRHQQYTSNAPHSQYELISPTKLAEVDTPEFHGELNRARNVFAAAKVRAIYLIHGTFAGDDLLGLLGEWERSSPVKAKWWRSEFKRLVDAVSGEWGNYTTVFANRLAGNNQLHSNPTIPVRLFSWSGENHHFARVDAAICLLDELFDQELTGGRVALWGHSHGGNVLALLTNLLAADEKTMQRFLNATGYLKQGQNRSPWDRPVWKRVLEKLAEEHCSLRDVQLDVVTFGTPIRYGWDLDGCTTLTHFVNHRPSDGFPEFLTCRPDLRSFTSGDMIHQLGIAGSDFLPSPFAWNNWKTERRLRKFIQVDCRGRDYWNNLSAGMRVAEDGFTWLVDYSNIDAELASQLFGHSVYTNSRWLSFHAHQIASRLNNPYSIRQEEIG